jgi:hypothetical protein
MSPFSDALDSWLLRRLRRAYGEATGHREPGRGLAGLIAEIRWAFESLPADQRAAGDRVFFQTVFFGPRAIRALRTLGRRFPDRVPTLLARASPAGLRFLVGEARFLPPAGNVLPDCAFRRRGGEVLCQKVCRDRTEEFTRDTLGVPLSLRPHADSYACTWRWGASDEDGAGTRP